MDSTEARVEMVQRQLVGRGISDPRVLEAFRTVPREAFLPPALAEFAYRDAPLPIGDGQTISQPYIVAVTLEALGLRGHERVLEIGGGSGYAAALLGRLAKEVFTVERIAALATQARDRLKNLGYANVAVQLGDGTLGWPQHAPYDAIAVAAGGPDIPRALQDQLAPGGRLVIPVGRDESSQVLVRVTRDESGLLRRENLADVRFVPLIGAQGWPEAEPAIVPAVATPHNDAAVVRLLGEAAEPISDIETASVDALLERIGDARLVLLGEATHGTSEFYRMRARITQALIQRRGFDFVAVEADWPDAARIDDYVLGAPRRSAVDFVPFSRFPTWMWRNEEVHTFVDWLRAHNLAQDDRGQRVGFHGLDLYSMFTSMAAVLAYLDQVDPDAARVARARYGSLTPWQKDPAAYGRAVLAGRYESSETAVVAMLREMLERRLDYAANDGVRFFDAAQNARVVADAERYYRCMYYDAVDSWNLRDTHMFETLGSLLSYYGPQSRGVVWEHNSHVGDAAATEMHLHGEHNVGQLSREAFGPGVYIVGFGTDHGTVAAADAWDAPMQRKRVRPAHAESYERLLHDTGLAAFTLHLRQPRRSAVRDELLPGRLERAIGVVYRPDTELGSHYLQASLPRQFDEFIWFDETRAVDAFGLERRASPDLPDTYPFGL
ncbi:MAG TPA: protein-L-isoaspartate(D-aspartate) O-methyltransferase [Polyangia bacterium]|nr:protein-L-isoaspartate(D-aspartate) O-methyltransferase [Polyangia bacterium]